jgi:hypothetical protein
MIKSRQGLPRHVLAVLYSKRAVAFGEMKKHEMAIQDYTVALNMDSGATAWKTDRFDCVHVSILCILGLRLYVCMYACMHVFM